MLPVHQGSFGPPCVASVGKRKAARFRFNGTDASVAASNIKDGLPGWSAVNKAWFYWWSSLLWAVPITFVLCVVSTGLSLTIAYALGAEEHSASEYVSTALVGFFLWGTVVFVGTCWFLIPLMTSVIALSRYLFRKYRKPVDETVAPG